MQRVFLMAVGNYSVRGVKRRGGVLKREIKRVSRNGRFTYILTLTTSYRILRLAGLPTDKENDNTKVLRSEGV